MLVTWNTQSKNPERGALDPESSAFDGVQDMKESCDGDEGPEVLMDALMQADDGNDYVEEVEGA